MSNKRIYNQILKFRLKQFRKLIDEDFADPNGRWNGVLDNLSDTHDPCDGCNNNPKNNPFASGVCYCTLGSKTTY